MSGFRCQFYKVSLMKVHYPKLYNMAHLLALYFTASKAKDLTIIFIFLFYFILFFILFFFLIFKKKCSMVHFLTLWPICLVNVELCKLKFFIIIRDLGLKLT